MPGDPGTFGEAAGPGGQGGGSLAVACGPGPEAVAVEPVALGATPAPRGRHCVTARRADGGVLAVDTADLGRAAQRRRLAEQALGRLGLPAPKAGLLADALDAALLELAAALAGPAHAPADDPSFLAVGAAAGPGLEGLHTATPSARIADLDPRIAEKTLVGDEDREDCRLRLVMRRGGREHALELSTAKFASNGRLRAAVYAAPLPGADLMAGADLLRRAAIALSDPPIRRVTTGTGWTADRARFLVPGGHVDAAGYHDDDPDSGLPRVDLSACEGARWLGLRRLDDGISPRSGATSPTSSSASTSRS